MFHVFHLCLCYTLRLAVGEQRYKFDLELSSYKDDKLTSLPFVELFVQTLALNVQAA